MKNLTFKSIEADKRKQEDESINQLFQYAQDNYKQYSVPDTDVETLLSTIRENKEKFETEVLPNTPDELVNRIVTFLVGVKDREIIDIFKKANFNYETLLSSQEDKRTKVRALLEAVLKAKSYDMAVEQNEDKEIDFSGFENDVDILDVKEFVYRVFGSDLLKKCLISKVKYTPDTVNVQIEGIDYMLPVDIYKEWESLMPEVKNRKFRAESFVCWNTDPKFSKKFIPTPIHVYSFSCENPEQLDYLAQVSIDQKMRLYKLGTITHEIAHHIYSYLLDTDRRAQWQELVDQTKDITVYMHSYRDDKLKYDEYFAEAVRLKTTASDCLKTKFPEINKFLTNNFPSIKDEVEK